MTDQLPQGYEPHELPTDYTGKLWIEGQMRAYAAAQSAADNAVLRAQMERQKDEWLSWDSKRASLEKSAARVQVLEDALDQCLDDMGEGHSVCEATKQYARDALEGTK